MKNLIFVFVSLFTIGLMTSCNKDNDVATTENLIEEISASSEKQNVSVSEMPVAAQEFVAEEHFETYIESAAYVEGKGYEVTLGTEDVEYFNAEGSVLRSDLHPNRCYRPGPCGGGQRIRIQNLPAGIVAYILDNYPDQEIRRAKIKGDYYLVGITGPTILVFESDNTFVAEAPLFRFCRGDRINVDNLTDVFVNYITENYPDGEIVVAYRVRGRIVIGVLTPEGRKVLIFTLGGEFLLELP